MDHLRFTLLSDGPSDRALLPVLSWVLQAAGEVTLSHGEWADLSVLWRGTTSLGERIQRAVELFPCDLLFIHRDAEKQHARVVTRPTGGHPWSARWPPRARSDELRPLDRADEHADAAPRLLRLGLSP